jgi:hypothetical protein
MTYFFFYNYLLNIELIKLIDEIFIIKDGYINIKSFDREKDELIIKDDKENKEILKGKLVLFPTLTLKEIVDQLYKLDNIKYKNRSIYKIEKIKVHIDDKDELEAYIIY